MATYFNQEDIDAAIQEKVDELGQSLEQRITAFTESIYAAQLTFYFN